MKMTHAVALLVLGAVLLTAGAAPSGTHSSPCCLRLIRSTVAVHAELASLGYGGCGAGMCACETVSSCNFRCTGVSAPHTHAERRAIRAR